MARRKSSKARWVRGARTKNSLLTEPVIAEGVITNLVPPTVLDARPIEVGTKVKIARVINTPIGHRLRIAHSTRWIARADVDIEYSDDVVVDYTGHLSPNGDKANSSKTKRKSRNSTKKTQKEFKARASRATSKVRRPRTVRRTERYTGMDKKQLRALISGFTTAERITVTFIGDLADRTGDYEVVDQKTGRGKGGSKLMVLRPVGGGEEFTTGTPQSDKILHVVTADGTVHGHQSIADIPRVFEMNAARGEELKTEMQKYVGTTGVRIRLDDTADEFGGEFTVTQAEQKRGRYGQVVFTLLGSTGRVQEFWSHRHSGIVPADGFEVLSAPTQSTTEDSTDEA